MQNLGDVIGTILTQINNGRAQADLAALELARTYKDDPMLARLPLRRVSVEEVVVELKVAFAQDSSPSGVLSVVNASRALDAVLALAEDLPRSAPDLKGYFDRNPGLAEAWRAAQAPIKERLWGFLFGSASMPLDVVVKHASSILSEYMLKVFLGAAAPVEAAQVYMAESAAAVDREIALRVARTFSRFAEGPAIGPGLALPVFVTADELESIPEEKISTLTFKVNEAGTR
jgi:hypothetical protein